MDVNSFLEREFATRMAGERPPQFAGGGALADFYWETDVLNQMMGEYAAPEAQQYLQARLSEHEANKVEKMMANAPTVMPKTLEEQQWDAVEKRTGVKMTPKKPESPYDPTIMGDVDG